MSFSNRNKEVAIKRWAKIHEEQKRKILNTPEAVVLKSVICGFLAGDGSVQIRKEKKFYHYQLDFFPDDIKMMNRYIFAINSVYHKIPSIRRRDNVFHVRLTSKVIVEDLLKYCHFGLREWNIPYCLFIVDGAKEAWLKAFFSAEAYVNLKSIKVQAINKRGILEISKILSGMNLRHHYYEYHPSKINHSTVAIISINRKCDREQFYNKIGFWHIKKTSRLKEALNL